MIVFKDILQQLADAGWSTYRLRKEKLLPESVIQRLRHGEAITTTTVDTICQLLDCQPGDILEYVEDAQKGRE